MNRGTMMIIMASVMLTLLGTSFYYVGRKLLNWLTLTAPAAHPKIVFIGVCVFFFLSIALSFLPFDMSIKKPLVWFAWFLIGIFVFALTFFVLSEIVLLIGKLLRVIPSPTPQNIIIITGWSVLALTASFVAYGTYNAGQIKHKSDTVSIINKETSLENLKIALISDVHLGYLNDEKWLAKIVSEINALEPDIVVMAGDIFNDNFKAFPDPTEGVRVLQSIKSKYGVYACVGNHDVGNTYPDMVRFLEDGNVKVLQDQYEIIEDKFIIVGRKDSRPISYQGAARKDISYVLEGVNTQMPIIVIDHNPSNIKEYGSEIDLLLTGHTHGGQMFPATFISPLIYPMCHGHYVKKGVNVTVTSGAGLWGPPFRIGTNNEIYGVLAEFKQ